MGSVQGAALAFHTYTLQRGVSFKGTIRFVSSTVEKIDNISQVAPKQIITGELCVKNYATSVYLVASGCDKIPNRSFRGGCCFPFCPLLVFSYQSTPQTDYCSESRWQNNLTPITVKNCFWQLGRGWPTLFLTVILALLLMGSGVNREPCSEIVLQWWREITCQEEAVVHLSFYIFSYRIIFVVFYGIAAYTGMNSVQKQFPSNRHCQL